MRFYSTQNKNLRASLKEAVAQGLAPGGGLYMPESQPVLDPKMLNQLTTYSREAIAFEVASKWIEEDVPKDALKGIIERTVFFEVPLVELHDNIFSLELFHGPTLAFKDFGARFMASLLGYFSQASSVETTVLVATSGDTGSAVAHGFHKVPGVRVIVLYPSGKVSALQEKQFTTLGENITALEIAGTFDDCQRLVKTAFGDADLQRKLTMTSANSINIARLIPQSFYYFFAVAQLEADGPVVFSVPSGNFGNLTAGVLAQRMGLKVDHFVAATNLNDVVPKYLHDSTFQPRPSIATISNAMDVGNPSNFARLLDLYKNDYEMITKVIKGYSFADEATREAMRKVERDYNYILDPHSAIGYLGLLEDSKKVNTTNKIFLATAHPGKFQDVVEDTLGHAIELPEKLLKLVDQTKKSIPMSNDFTDLKEFLMK